MQMAIKRDPIALATVGDDIRFRDAWPWVHGEINQNRGNIDFTYAIRGSGQLSARTTLAERY